MEATKTDKLNRSTKKNTMHSRSHGYPRAIDEGYSLCHLCDHAVPSSESNCEYCHSQVHQRDRQSMQAAWAWVIAAAIFYGPAMIFPVSTVIFLGMDSPSTLIQSVVIFWHHGAWHIAIVIFVASVFIPGFKIIAIIYILSKMRLHRRNKKQCKQVTKLYKFVEFIGRWSMIDVFVVALLVALVQFGGLASMLPGLGVFCFSIVVVASIFAAHKIDIRLLWDEK